MCVCLKNLGSFVTVKGADFCDPSCQPRQAFFDADHNLSRYQNMPMIITQLDHRGFWTLSAVLLLLCFSLPRTHSQQSKWMPQFPFLFRSRFPLIFTAAFTALACLEERQVFFANPTPSTPGGREAFSIPR